MNQKQALSVIYNCAKKYNDNLKDYNIMFVIEDKRIKEKIYFVESMYYIHNFLHLTGIDYISNKNLKNASIFYSNLLKGKISYKQIKFKNPTTTELKLQILYNLCTIDKTAKFINKMDIKNYSKVKKFREKIGSMFYI